MGNCTDPQPKKLKSKHIKKSSIIYEVYKENNPKSIPIDKIQRIMEQMEKSICKMNLNDLIGEGFICLLSSKDRYNLIPVLITYNHI